MARLSDTLSTLDPFRIGAASPIETRLVSFRAATPNPGSLDAFCHIPDTLPAGAPLVVVLHGCTQTAGGYDHGTGWSRLADEAGFAVLFAQQRRANNANLCFNWFEPGDIVRRGGEAESIAGFATAAIAAHNLDADRVFVTGLSAGGAMSAVMLATYPELFAGGAIIGGLPYGCAASVAEALMRMRGQGHVADADAVARVRAVAPVEPARWPTISLWHGTADTTVSATNMALLGRQWRGVHSLDAGQPAVERGAGWEHACWSGQDGRVLVEEWSITGMGHGVPIDAAAGLGSPGPHMLDVGIDSTRAIAAGWGIADAAPSSACPAAPARAADPPAGRSEPSVTHIQHTIEDALRAAGLMR